MVCQYTVLMYFGNSLTKFIVRNKGDGILHTLPTYNWEQSKWLLKKECWSFSLGKRLLSLLQIMGATLFPGLSPSKRIREVTLYCTGYLGNQHVYTYIRIYERYAHMCRYKVDETEVQLCSLSRI